MSSNKSIRMVKNESQFFNHFHSDVNVRNIRVTQSSKSRTVIAHAVKCLVDRLDGIQGITIRGTGRCISKCLSVVEAVKRDVLRALPDGEGIFQINEISSLEVDYPGQQTSHANIGDNNNKNKNDDDDGDDDDQDEKTDALAKHPYVSRIVVHMAAVAGLFDMSGVCDGHFQHTTAAGTASIAASTTDVSATFTRGRGDTDMGGTGMVGRRRLHGKRRVKHIAHVTLA